MNFEVQDSRGNKVFRKVTQTSKFGIASAEFELADEVNLGTYHLRAVMGGEEASANSAELALNVERYVLPKFKVAIDFDGKDKHVKRDYRPGDHVTGTVRANYFFGKPVDDAVVKVKATGVDVGEYRAVSEHGKTKAEAITVRSAAAGLFRGPPARSGGRGACWWRPRSRTPRAILNARRADTVSKSPLTIIAVPEGGELVPGLENQVFVVTAYPDGTPAVAKVKVHAEGSPEQSATTDEGGVAVVRVRPGAGHETLQIEAADKEGNRATRSVHPEVRNGADQILLRTEHAVYRAGDRIALRVFSTKKRGIGIRGCGPRRADRADARPGHGERAGGVGADRHAGPGGHGGYPRLPVRAGRAGDGRSPSGFRRAGQTN